MKKIRLIILMFFAVAISSCISGKRLSTSNPLDSLTINNEVYDVILYGQRTPYDVETVAILDRAEDTIQITSTARLYDHQIKKNLNAEDAYQKAVSFLEACLFLQNIEKRKIIGSNGEIIGYEFRPYFSPLYVNNNSLSISYYQLSDKTVKFDVTWLEFFKPFEGRDL